jgi:Skp family chaperone for outer membrane proteins
VEPRNDTSRPDVGGGPTSEGKVQKVREFRRRAKECRESAAKATNAELKQHYEDIAAVWDKLAEERLEFFVEHPEADRHGEVDADKSDGNGTSP